MSDPHLTEKQQYWLKHLTHYDEFTGTLKEYAAANNLKLTDLYGWRKILRDKGVIEPVAKSAETTTTPSFSRVQLPVPHTGQSIQIRAGRSTVMLSHLPDPQWLATVMMTLESQP